MLTIKSKKDRELQDEYLRQKQDEPDTVFTILFYLFKFIATILGVAIRSVPAIVSTLGILWLTNNSHIALAILVALIIVVLIAADVMNRLPKFVTHIVPFTSDSRRIVKFFKKLRARRRGKEILYDIGLLTDRTSYEFSNSAEFYIDKRQSCFIVEPLRGISPQKVVNTIEENKDRWDAKRIRTDVLEKGKLRFTLFHDDPLDNTFPLTEPAKLDPETMSVECALNDVGEKMSITFKGTSGMLVGGEVGSGKTAGLTSMLMPFALSPDVHFTVIDGKGGGDWLAYEPVADIFFSGADTVQELEEIDKVLSDAREKMTETFQTNKQVLGDSNFWGVSLEKRRKANRKFHLILIDEAQDLFNHPSKEGKAVVASIQDSITRLVKKGRSAGFFVVLCTQKPTSDALPTGIRDNLGIRLSFKVNTSDVERAIFGTLPDDVGIPRATAIPSHRKGGAVMTGKNGLEAVRFAYMPEQRQEEIINEFVKKSGRRNVEQTDKSQFSFSLDEYTKVEDSAVA